MRNKYILVLTLLVALVLGGCSSDSDSGSKPNAAQSCIIVEGDWFINEEVDATACGGEVTTSETSYRIDQSACAVTLYMYATPGKFDGNVNGNTFNWRGTYAAGPITVTVNGTANVSGDTLSGSATWTENYGTFSCTNTVKITGMKF